MKINLHVLIFIVVAVITSINDIIIYTCNLNYNISLLFSCIMLIIPLILLIKRKKVLVQNDFDKIDLFFIIPILLYSSILMIKCDYSYDTKNYHIYLQENYFNDKINFDFFPGRTINSFVFPLGDRINYLFRYFLGYRIGVIFSLYTLIILFYQMKKILKEMLPNISSKKLLFFSISPTMLYCVNEFVGTYYIDNYSFVILLELIAIFLKQNNIFKEKINLYYIFLVLGIATGIKLPNLILGAVIFIAIIINNFVVYGKKEIIDNFIKTKDIITICILFLFPFIIYAIDNYLQTGSLIYPYYNKILKSEYFGNINWSDEAFGISNWWDSLIWPIIITINPLKGNNSALVDIIWLVGYVICIVDVIIYRKKCNTIYKLSILSIILSIVWTIFLMGYARYAIIIPIIYYIVIINTVNELNLKNEIEFIIYIFIIVILIITYILNFYYSIQKIEYSLKSIYTKDECIQNEEIYEIDGVWGSINDNSAMITLIRNKNIPIYNLDNWHYLYCEKTEKLYYEKINDKKIYTIVNMHDLEKCINKIYEQDFEIAGEPKIYKNYKIQNNNDFWFIIELKYVGEKITK